MDISINLYDLGVLILFLILAGVGIYLIMALRRLINLLAAVHEVVETNKEDVRDSLSLLPDIARNTEEITSTVKESVTTAGTAVDVISSSVAETVTTAAHTADQITAYATIITEVVKTVVSLFSKFSGKK